MGKKNKNRKKPSKDTTPYASNKQTRQNLPQTAAPNTSNKQTRQKLPQTASPNASNKQTRQNLPQTASPNASNKQTRQRLPQTAAPNASNKQTRQNLPQTASPNASNKQTRQRLPQTSTPNVSFYQNKIPSSPNTEYIEDILVKWPGNYEKLEKNPSYIQWLFPNRMPGVNQHAFILTDEEVKIFNKSPKLKEKVKNAFVMMLDFYGMRITRNNQFELAENSRERLAALNQTRNPDFKRISRILLAIKELGHIDLMRPWMIFLADLIYKEKELEQASESFLQFWIETLDAEDKIFLTHYVEQFNL